MKNSIKGQSKQQYRSPKFEVYGNISRLTAVAQSAKGGIKADGSAAPNTKA